MVRVFFSFFLFLFSPFFVFFGKFFGEGGCGAAGLALHYVGGQSSGVQQGWCSDASARITCYPIAVPTPCQSLASPLPHYPCLMSLLPSFCANDHLHNTLVTRHALLAHSAHAQIQDSLSTDQVPYVMVHCIVCPSCNLHMDFVSTPLCPAALFRMPSMLLIGFPPNPWGSPRIPKGRFSLSGS